jgi:hypothetical protein
MRVPSLRTPGPRNPRWQSPKSHTRQRRRTRAVRRPARATLSTLWRGCRGPARAESQLGADFVSNRLGDQAGRTRFGPRAYRHNVEAATPDCHARVTSAVRLGKCRLARRPIDTLLQENPSFCWVRHEDDAENGFDAFGAQSSSQGDDNSAAARHDRSRACHGRTARESFDAGTVKEPRRQPAAAASSLT